VVKTNYHPKENNWIGYIIDVDGVLVYHAGDTERIPEMRNMIVDIALLPLGQTYTMNSVEEAAEAAIDINPSIAVPIHYGMYEGSVEDALKFKELLAGKVEVVILEPVQ
jgi:L-ascorbate metabolism protein UlaG (beta-lactamase superfamily)